MALRFPESGSDEARRCESLGGKGGLGLRSLGSPPYNVDLDNLIDGGGAGLLLALKGWEVGMTGNTATPVNLQLYSGVPAQPLTCSNFNEACASRCRASDEQCVARCEASLSPNSRSAAQSLANCLSSSCSESPQDERAQCEADVCSDERAACASDTGPDTDAFLVGLQSFEGANPSNGVQLSVDADTECGRVNVADWNFRVNVPLAEGLELPLVIARSQFRATVAVREKGIAIDDGLLTGYVTRGAVEDLLSSFRVFCACPDLSTTISLICGLAGGTNGIELVMDQVLGGADALVNLDGSVDPACGGDPSSCNAISVCLELDVRPAVMLGLEPQRQGDDFCRD